MDSHRKPGKNQPPGSLPAESAPDAVPGAAPGALTGPAPGGDEEVCLRWEASLVDLLDGVLAPEQEAAFREHAENCPQCQALLRESERGRDWARLLHDTPPAVPEELLGKILAHTTGHPSGAGAALSTEPGAGHDLPLAAGNVLVLPHPAVWSARSQKQARILMTAAMAFFSIALTLSMTGFHLSDVRTAVQSPGSLGVTASRQFFDTRKQVVNFYENLRLVREMEVTVEDLRQSAGGGNKKNDRPQGPQPSARSLSGEDVPATLLARCEVSRLAPCELRPYRDQQSPAFRNEQAGERNTL